jgi:hypothetical protein
MPCVGMLLRLLQLHAPILRTHLKHCALASLWFFFVSKQVVIPSDAEEPEGRVAQVE